MESKSGAVIYFRNWSHEYYSIDLDCLAESRKLVPISQFESSGWTVIDECIYSLEGLKDDPEQNFNYIVAERLHKYNTTSSSSNSGFGSRSTPTWEFISPHRNSSSGSSSGSGSAPTWECMSPSRNSSSGSAPTWECISPSRYLRWHNPFVFAFDRKKIYVVGGQRLPPELYECDKDTDWTIPGEYYHLDSQTWQCLSKPPKLEDMDQVDFSSFSVARVMDDKTRIIFYSNFIILLYDVVKDVWEQHFNAKFGLLSGLEGRRYCLDLLISVIGNTRPVVCHSTLYWFNNDLCLYGYDYIQHRWFRSNSLQEQLDWPHIEDRHTMPFLFYQDNQTFVALSPITGTKELALAIIAVNRDRESLNVSLILFQNFTVETLFPEINIFDGMTIWKDKGSMLGKREFALVD